MLTFYCKYCSHFTPRPNMIWLGQFTRDQGMYKSVRLKLSLMELMIRCQAKFLSCEIS